MENPAEYLVPSALSVSAEKYHCSGLALLWAWCVWIVTLSTGYMHKERKIRILCNDESLKTVESDSQTSAIFIKSFVQTLLEETFLKYYINMDLWWVQYGVLWIFGNNIGWGQYCCQRSIKPILTDIIGQYLLYYISNVYGSSTVVYGYTYC